MRIAAFKVEAEVDLNCYCKLLSKEILPTSFVEIYVTYFDNFSQSTNFLGTEKNEIFSKSQTYFELVHTGYPFDLKNIWKWQYTWKILEYCNF